MLTPRAVAEAPRYINALKQRELLLRDRQIARIENLGVTQNSVDVIDFTNNALIELDNFPALPRLKGLLAANNYIRAVDEKLGGQLPNLEILTLANNRLGALKDLRFLTGLKKLTYLTLAPNPVSQDPHYRLYVIWLAPNVRILDYTRVRDSERKQAHETFGTHEAPTALVSELEGGAKVAPPLIKTKLSEADKQALQKRLAAATTLAEIDEIEAALRASA